MGRRDTSRWTEWSCDKVRILPNGVRLSCAKSSRYYYDGHVHVIPEFDGIRLITNDTCEFLHKVTGKFFMSVLAFPVTDHLNKMLRRKFSDLDQRLLHQCFWTL